MITVIETIPDITVRDSVSFDFSGWLKKYGKGKIRVWFRPHGAKGAHRIRLPVVGNIATWDNITTGGTAQFDYRADSGEVIKSNIFSVMLSSPEISGKSVIVNGDLEEALSMFSSMVKKEGILKEYNNHQQFAPKRKRSEHK